MQDIIDNSYNYALVDSNPANIKYEFVSEGSAEVPKRVSIRPIFHGYYNLGFGDIEINDEGVEKVNDKAKNVNKADGKKIINTALLCSFDFLSNTTGNKIAFFGNTAAKHRWYKWHVCGNLQCLSDLIDIKGGIIHGIDIATDEDGFKDIANKTIDPDNVELEPFNVANCHRYNFITYEIKI